MSPRCEQSAVTSARRDGLLLSAILILATILRFVGLPGRGAWDDDQGNEILAMLLWVRGGDLPLRGPISSVPDLHHGVGFYWLLAPSAFLTDANPIAAAATLAVVGVGGVAATWWLGRTVAGSLAGHVAGLLMAVSPSAISASTFVWNSNIVAPFAALAIAAGWHAWRTRRAHWWLVAAVGALFMLHGHLLTLVAVPPLAALLVADVVRRPREDRRKMLGPVLGAAAIVAVGYVPTVIYEASALARYLTDAGSSGGPPLILLPLIILWRIQVWPVSGPVAFAVLGGLPAAIIVATALVIGATGKPGLATQFGRWAVVTIAWAVLALTFLSPTLAEFTPGLPNDQYHSWLTPIVFAVIGVSVARLTAAGLPARTSAIAIVVSCLALSLASMPPLSSPDGGWPKAAQTAAEIRAAAGDQPIAVTGVAKSGAAMAFPLWRDGKPNTSFATAEILIVTCDRLFERSVGMPCGGPAESAIARQVG
jgi:4-amino-4-deoxy-L-arabinose transferase-like glycosyltransferase